MPRRVRTLFLALVALAAWLVAGTALAAAPMCDDRGASAFAPSPTLDPPNESIDIGTGPDACAYAVDDGVSLHEGRGHDPLPSPTMADVLPTSSGVRVIAAVESTIAPSFVSPGGRPGVHGRLERPPR